MDEAKQQMGVVFSCAQGGRPGMGLFLALSLRCDWTKVWLLRLSRLLDGFIRQRLFWHAAMACGRVELGQAAALCTFQRLISTMATLQGHTQRPAPVSNLLYDFLLIVAQ